MRRSYDTIHDERDAAAERIKQAFEGCEPNRETIDGLTDEERDEWVRRQMEWIQRDGE